MNTPTAESKNKAFEKMKRELESQIAEREALLETLRQSEERFRILVDGVKDCAIYLLSVDGVVTTWNSGAEHIKGYRPEEIIGKNFACFYRLRGHSDRQTETVLGTSRRTRTIRRGTFACPKRRVSILG